MSTKPAATDQMKPENGPPEFLLRTVNAINAGAYNDAIEFLKEGIAEHPSTAYSGIGEIYLHQGKYEQAIEWLEKALECEPDSGKVLGNIGQSLAGLGRKTEAAEILARAIKLETDAKEIHLLVETMFQIRKSEQAIKPLEEKANSDPTQVGILFDLGKLLEMNRLYSKAEYWYKKILEIAEYADAYIRLGIICYEMCRMSDSVDYLRKADELLPNNGYIYSSLAKSIMQLGNTEEAIRLLRKAVDLMPENADIHSNLLFRLHYLPEIDREMLFEEHKRWGQRHAPISMARTGHDNTAEPDRKLRIGYISPDFRNHVVNFYFEPLLREHDRELVEVFGYGNVKHPDKYTEKIEKNFDHYHDIWGVSDEAVARMIKEDKIDILIDLAGHTKCNRLLVLARKPAPIQVTYLGYADTTGMEAIDYFLTNNLLTPPESQRFYTEELFPLPEAFACYTPLDESPNVTVSPVIENGYITFGAFITNRRFNQTLLKTWSEILKLSGNSRLLLCFSGGDDEIVQAKYLRQFEKQGVPRDRITIRGMRTYFDYLKQYGEVDVVLDTFPENGGTTTCDAFWMGVPVISLIGQHQIGRYGLSLLSNIGLEFFATITISEYIAKAVTLASKPESLIKIRRSMRLRISNSAICDSKRFTHYVEIGYREMWHRWCREQGASIPNGTHEI